MKNNEKATLVQSEENSPKKKELGMGWHDFMIFCRGFTGVGGIIGGILLGILSFFVAYAPFAYIICIACIALAIYSLDVRDSLKNLEADAPKKLIRYHVFSMIMGIVDSFSAFFIGPLTSNDTVDVSGLVGAILRAVIMIAINSSYYAKRRHMFEDDEEE